MKRIKIHNKKGYQVSIRKGKDGEIQFVGRCNYGHGRSEIICIDRSEQGAWEKLKTFAKGQGV
ncbi:MAG: hypothetical protein GY909_15305 [Oligoflexia bacterium]|nr:hypothetical protein [Oligoflexia bacterium]